MLMCILNHWVPEGGGDRQELSVSFVLFYIQNTKSRHIMANDELRRVSLTKLVRCLVHPFQAL